MTAVRVFDPAMCCSSGICGPSVDPQLIRFAADLDWLKGQGVSVERFNLSQQPAAFAQEAAVKSALETQGDACLPLVMVNGQVKSGGVYPSRDQLARWAGVGAPAPSIFTEAVAELVAIGAAVASNCEPCFKFHYDKARKLGVSREDMLRAVTTAQSVKDTPARAILDLARRHLESHELRQVPKEQAGGCCGSSTTSGPQEKSGCC